MDDFMSNKRKNTYHNAGVETSMSSSSNSNIPLLPDAPVFRSGPEYKLYVTPILDEHDHKSLEKIFSSCGEVIEVYISDKKETGFRWAFIYYKNRESAEEAIEKLNGHIKYKFNVRFAKDKSKRAPPAQVKDDNRFNNSYISPISNCELLNGSMLTNPAVSNGIAYYAPPNCKTCKKLTAYTCSLCQNAFCNTECSLDGWKYHTSECIKIASLEHSSERSVSGSSDTCNGTGSHISDTVVNFMRRIRENNENFKTNEFAAVCSDRVVKPMSLNGSDVYQNCDTQPSVPLEKKSKPKNHQRFSAKSEIISSNSPTSKSSKKRYDSFEADEVKSSHVHQPRDAHIDFKPTRKPDNVSYNVKNNAYEDVTKNATSSLRLSHTKVSLNSKSKTKEAAITDYKLEVGEITHALITLIEDSYSFFIAEPSKFIPFMEKMKEENIAQLEHLENVKVGSWCFSFFEDDWYRAQIVSVNPLEVLYVDFGNKEVTDKKYLRVMPVKYKKIPPLACKVKLYEGDVNEHNVIENEQVVIYPVKYDESSEQWIVKIL